MPTRVLAVHSYLERLVGILERLTIIVKGLRAIAGLFMGLAILGGLLMFVGFILAGWWWWLGLLIGLAMCWPAFVLWRFRVALEAAILVPTQLRAMPTSGEEVKEDLTPMLAVLDGMVEKPKSPRAFVKSAMGTKEVMDLFNDSHYGKLLGGIVILNPAALLAGGTMTMFATGSFAIGLLMFLLGRAI